MDKGIEDIINLYGFIEINYDESQDDAYAEHSVKGLWKVEDDD